MSRPIRIEFPDALYHVTSRGNRRETIFDDDEDRRMLLLELGQVVAEFNWRCYAWCLMDNHYHLLIQTPDSNLSQGMRQLNGIFTQASNHRHRRVGHLFQGRFKAILVDGDSYFLELLRYIVLNPVRAAMVAKPEDWRWSSYSACAGLTNPEPWLAVEGVLSQFDKQRGAAQQAYAQFVLAGIHADSPWKQIKGQVYLGDEQFVQRMQAGIRSPDDVQIPLAQRRPPAPSIAEIARNIPDRETAIRTAHATGAYSYQEIAKHFGLHFTTIGRIVRAGKLMRQSQT
jgi:REP element-mobilizing transposase RayT